jgi:hypothetical protein
LVQYEVTQGRDAAVKSADSIEELTAVAYVGGQERIGGLEYTERTRGGIEGGISPKKKEGSKRNKKNKDEESEGTEGAKRNESSNMFQKPAITERHSRNVHTVFRYSGPCVRPNCCVPG